MTDKTEDIRSQAAFLDDVGTVLTAMLRGVVESDEE